MPPANRQPDPTGAGEDCEDVERMPAESTDAALVHTPARTFDPDRHTGQGERSRRQHGQDADHYLTGPTADTEASPSQQSQSRNRQEQSDRPNHGATSFGVLHARDIGITSQRVRRASKAVRVSGVALGQQAVQPGQPSDATHDQRHSRRRTRPCAPTSTPCESRLALPRLRRSWRWSRRRRRAVGGLAAHREPRPTGSSAAAHAMSGIGGEPAIVTAATPSM